LCKRSNTISTLIPRDELLFHNDRSLHILHRRAMHTHRTSSFKSSIIIPGYVLIIFLVCIASGCQSQTMEPVTTTPSQTATVPATIQPSPTYGIMQQKPAEWMAWESGAHASSGGTECKTCHEVVNGQLAGEAAWYDQGTGGYVSIEDTNEICGKCHTDRQMLGLGDQTHSGFSCTTCHDAHSLRASCTNPGCHSDLDRVNPLALPFVHPARGNCSQAGCHEVVFVTPTPGPSEVLAITWNHHDGHHLSVSCAACHDAGGLGVGKLDNIWVTMDSSTTEYYPSHNIQRSVDCNRCHFPDNPWGLMVISPETQE
jgi:hypothetical protein